MPLMKSSSKEAFSRNVSAEMHAGKPQKQALAIAYSIQRRAGKAYGGPVGYAQGGAPPWFVRSEARDMERYGMMHGATPGRADLRPANVRGGSYVVPADIVSSLGQGNSNAGAMALNKMFRMGPYGTAGTPNPRLNRQEMPRMQAPALGRMAVPRMPGSGKMFAGGGDVPIKVSDGEFLIPPDKVAEIGNGDLEMGHNILDHLVQMQRKKAIQHLSSLPPPRDSQQSFDDGGDVLSSPMDLSQPDPAMDQFDESMLPQRSDMNSPDLERIRQMNEAARGVGIGTLGSPYSGYRFLGIRR